MFMVVSFRASGCFAPAYRAAWKLTTRAAQKEAPEGRPRERLSSGAGITLNRRPGRAGQAVGRHGHALAQPAAQDLAQEVLGQLGDDLELARPLVLAQVQLAVLLQRSQVDPDTLPRHQQRLDHLAALAVGLP